MSRSKPAAGAPAKTAGAYLDGAVFLSGACTLVLEIVGTRVISPYYGSSLYCWSAIITATLVALALGYYLGGRWADRNPEPTIFALACAGAGLAIVTIPLARSWLLPATASLGVRAGSLAAALALMGPALVFLGTLTPIAVRLRTDLLANVGSRAGRIYALSTLGSVIGAMAAGFWLIPNFPISKILYGCSMLMLALSAVCLAFSRSGWAWAGTAAAVCVAFYGWRPQDSRRTNILLSRESPYGQIKVMDFNRHRYLLVNGTTQSLASLDTLESESEYARAMEWAALLRPGAERALVIGVGAGLLPMALERNYPLSVDSVDIDPEIIEVARTYFGFSPKRGAATVEDGRTFLSRCAAQGRRYDLIFLDAFATESPPYHLFTLESFQVMRQALEPDGILAVNLVSLVHGKGGRPWRSAYKTLQAAFPGVRAFMASDAYEGLANIVFLASAGPLHDEKAHSRLRPSIKADVLSMLSRELKVSGPEAQREALLSDEHAPIEFLLAESALQWRRGLQQRVPDILLY
ncbi:MAG: fused MFS/spermidine synthase [Elusimicrobia bacterium]|nr:fused MFS/spermidine synthase [Elusimicrobiota bacterium]